MGTIVYLTQLEAMKTKFETDSKRLQDQGKAKAIELERRYENMAAAKLDELKSTYQSELDKATQQLKEQINQLNADATRLENELTRYRKCSCV